MTAVSANASCPEGGLRVDSESGASYVCHGRGVAIAAEPAGANCAGGGVRIEAGSSVQFVCNAAPAPAALEVVDGNNRVLGRAIGSNGPCQLAYVDAQGLAWNFGPACHPNATPSYEGTPPSAYYYPTTDCSGTAYVVGSVANVAFTVSGQAFRTTEQVLKPATYRSTRAFPSGSCMATSGTLAATLIGLVASSAPPAIVPPLKIR